MEIISHIKKIVSNLPGWQTKRRLVVIESDDWGSIRMPSLAVLKELEEVGINITNHDNGRYNSLDTLGSSDDLDALFTTLMKFRDINGRHPVLTALTLTSNPDFDKIANDDFQNYYAEPITETFKKYGIGNSLAVWKEGERNHLFYPEFHGREHLNVKLWLNDLRDQNIQTLEAFRRSFWGFRNTKNRISYQSAFDLDNLNDLDYHKEVITDGLNRFENLHGRRAQYFVPPNGAIRQSIIDFAVALGINFVSTPKIFLEPQGNGKVKKKFRYLGMHGSGNMHYLTRNCFFEPSYQGKGYSVEDCLGHIKTSFLFDKPAIISTHRVNYVGGLKPQNRLAGNNALEKLLAGIIKNWPRVEFMTSIELGAIVRSDP